MYIEFDHSKKSVVIWATMRDTKESIQKTEEFVTGLGFQIVIIESGLEDLVLNTKTLLKNNIECFFAKEDAR